MHLHYSGMSQTDAEALRAGAPDVYGNRAETAISDGDGIPCRVCLGYVEKGEPYLILAYRPFPALQPYAETGPVFIHSRACTPHDRARGMPERVRNTASQMILRGYGADDRIVYGTGSVVGADQVETRARAILADPGVAYVHMRSATNNCFTLRIDRGQATRG